MKCSRIIVVIFVCCALASSVAAIAAISNSMMIDKKDNIVVDVTPRDDKHGSGDDLIDKVVTPKPTVKATETPSPTQTIKPTEEPVISTSVRSIDPTKPIVALSFDDGPGTAKSSERILNVLEQYEINATFFLVGDMAKHHLPTIQREIALGCEVGNHTQTHETNFREASIEKIQSELDSVDDIVQEAVGTRTYLVRPPWGAYNETSLEGIERPFIMWSVDTEDWKSRNKDEIVKVVKRDVFDGCIILMHDIYEPTAEAVEEVVPWLIENGYQVCSVSDMFAARGVKLEAGHAYNKAPTADEYMAEKGD